MENSCRIAPWVQKHGAQLLTNPLIFHPSACKYHSKKSITIRSPIIFKVNPHDFNGDLYIYTFHDFSMFFWETLTFPCCPWGLDALGARLIEQEGQECVARCMASETRTYREHFLGSIVDEVRYEHWGPWGHCHVIVILYILCIYYVYVYIYIRY